jgi:hypothetical protein
MQTNHLAPTALFTPAPLAPTILVPQPAQKGALLTAKEMAERYHIGVHSWWRIAREPDCPPAIKLGPRTPRWNPERMDQFMVERSKKFKDKHPGRRPRAQANQTREG